MPESEEIKDVLKEMNESFKSVASQGKQNNTSAFIQDIPYFGEPQDYDKRKTIIPLTESVRFLQIVDTQTSKNDFTDSGKIGVLKNRLIGSAREYWNDYDGEES